MVLADWTSERELCIWLCLPHGYALLPLPSQLGSVDLRFRSLIHSHLERPAILLRDVLTLQWGGETLLVAAGVLAILDVLCQSINLLVSFDLKLIAIVNMLTIL